MGEAAPVVGSGRRLPQWMLGRSATDQVEKKSDKTEVNKEQLKEGLSSRTCNSGSRTVTTKSEKESLLHEKEKKLESSHLLAKCKTRGRKLKVKQRDADSDTNISEDEQPKKYSRTGKTSSKSASRKRRKTKECGIKGNEELEIQALSEGDDKDLTVEDLMTIAEEVTFSSVIISTIFFFLILS